MGIVYIKGLRAEAIIGIHDFERETRQTLVVDVEMASDTRRAAASDKIGFAVDYTAVSNRVTTFIEASHYYLIETLAEALASMIKRDFSVTWLRLRLSKPGAVVAAEDVGVVVERGERP